MVQAHNDNSLAVYRAMHRFRNEAEQEHARAARWFRDQARARGPTRIAELMSHEGMLGRDGKPYTALAACRMLKRGKHASGLEQTH